MRLPLRLAETVAVSVVVAELRDDSGGDGVGLVDDIRIDLASAIIEDVALMAVNEHVADCILRALLTRKGNNPPDQYVRSNQDQ